MRALFALMFISRSPWSWPALAGGAPVTGWLAFFVLGLFLGLLIGLILGFAVTVRGQALEEKWRQELRAARCGPSTVGWSDPRADA